MLHDFLAPYWSLQAKGLLTWQLLMVLAAEAGLLRGRGYQREDGFMSCFGFGGQGYQALMYCAD